MRKLTPHHKNNQQSAQVAVDWVINDHFFNVTFLFEGTSLKNEISGTPFNWGLWEQDVLEVFVREKGHSSYLEIQIAPSKQLFALIVEKPREKFYFARTDELSFSVSAHQAEISIPLSLIPEYTNGDLEGNFFAVIDQNFYAMTINSEDQPDFHRPDLFRSLV